MDTTYVNTIIVAFLVVAALVVSIGYLYVDEEDLRSVAEVAALAGAQEIRNRNLVQLQSAPDRLAAVAGDTVQAEARAVAVTQALGKHKEAALTHAFNDNGNRLTTANDVTVGFWNISTKIYTPGATPVNAIQVRTRRTAESEGAGIGRIGNIFGTLFGVQKFDYTPDAVAALPPRADVNFTLCTEACESRCSYPSVCTVAERKFTSTPFQPERAAAGSLAATYLLYQLNTAVNVSDLICMGTTPQAVCRKEVFTAFDQQDRALRDLKSVMYNPNVDVANKEYDKATGRLLGWWVIAPVADCRRSRPEATFERRSVERYALVRISRICTPGGSGCQQNNTTFDAPAAVCGSERGLFIDRISCVNCNGKELLQFPGLTPVLVSESGTPH